MSNDRETVISGLQHMLRCQSCIDCPYDDVAMCNDAIINDAIALLTEPNESTETGGE